VRTVARASRIDDGVPSILVLQRETAGPRVPASEAGLLAEALELAPVALAVVDAQGVLRRLNARFAGLLGRPRGDLEGRPLEELLDAPVSDEGRRLVDAIGSGHRWIGRMRPRRSDGQAPEFDASATPLPPASGQATGAVLVLGDMARLDRLDASLERLERLDSIGMVAGGVAHDLRNILGAVLGYADLARGELTEGSGAAADLDLAAQAARRAADLVADLLDLARGQDRGSARARPAPTVRESLRLLRAMVPSTVELVESLDCELPISCQASELQRIVVNLVVNAAQALQDGHGTIRVGLEAAPRPAAGVTSRATRWVCLEVSDDGCGMPPEVRRQIFQPFFTTRPPGLGTGLGLAGVRRIVDARGGAVTVESEVGAGTTFRVLLPAADEPAPADEELDAGLPGTERILVVDDEPMLVAIVKRAMAKLGYQVAGFTDGEAAWRHLQRAPGCCDVVLLDLSMPGLSGDRLARKVRELRPELPIILWSGNPDAITPAEARAAGIDLIATKPLPAERLSRLVRTAIDRRLGARRPAAP
jgi:PAS domain S-box-containing protein